MTPNGLKDFYKKMIRGGSLACLCMVTALMAHAQSADKKAVINVLNAVPVYFVTTASGSAPTVDTGQQSDVVPVFLYSQEAGIAQAELESEGATGLKVVREELGTLYSGELSKKNEGINYGLVANPTQLAAARRLSADTGFSEVPVFIAKHKLSDDVMTMKQSDGTLAVPLFLEFYRIEAALDALGKQFPDMVDAFRIEAYPLSAIISDMQTGALNPANAIMIPPAN